MTFDPQLAIRWDVEGFSVYGLSEWAVFVFCIFRNHACPNGGLIEEDRAKMCWFTLSKAAP